MLLDILAGMARPPAEIDQGPRDETLKTAVPILVVGMPGKMASLVAGGIVRTDGCILLPYAVCSTRHNREIIPVGDRQLELRNSFPAEIGQEYPGVIAVDYTNAQSAVLNATDYTRLGVPFVMGTTGGDRGELTSLVSQSRISAVIAPNMATEVVALQDELADLPVGYFSGWKASIRESHQVTKKGVSGTAVALREQLEKLGTRMDGNINNGEIEMIRNRQMQSELGIQNLDAHAYHWIKLTGPNGETWQRQTAIEGREPYVAGTLMAIDFLAQRMREGSCGEVFSMSDVLRGRVA